MEEEYPDCEVGILSLMCIYVFFGGSNVFFFVRSVFFLAFLIFLYSGSVEGK